MENPLFDAGIERELGERERPNERFDSFEGNTDTGQGSCAVRRTGHTDRCQGTMDNQHHNSIDQRVNRLRVANDDDRRFIETVSL
jgi:hypothetical protein